MCSSLRARLVAKGARFELCENSQSIDGPLFELFKSDICRRRHDIEVQTVPVIKFLVCWRSELFLLVIDVGPPFGIDSREVLLDHLVRCYPATNGGY